MRMQTHHSSFSFGLELGYAPVLDTYHYQYTKMQFYLPESHENSGENQTHREIEEGGGGSLPLELNYSEVVTSKSQTHLGCRNMRVLSTERDRDGDAKDFKYWHYRIRSLYDLLEAEIFGREWGLVLCSRQV